MWICTYTLFQAFPSLLVEKKYGAYIMEKLIVDFFSDSQSFHLGPSLGTCHVKSTI